MSDDELIDELDIGELYELSLATQQAEERAAIMDDLTQDLALLGVSRAYLEVISKNVFKAKIEALDNKKLLYLKKILGVRIGKLAAEGKIDISGTEQLYI